MTQHIFFEIFCLSAVLFGFANGIVTHCYRCHELDAGPCEELVIENCTYRNSKCVHMYGYRVNGFPYSVRKCIEARYTCPNVIEELKLYNADSTCDFCNTYLCNYSSTKQLSVYAILFIFLSQLLHRFFFSN